MKTISLVINVDTRPERLSEGNMLQGTTCSDFLTAGIINKIKFFHDIPLETIVYTDIHEPIPAETWNLFKSWQDNKLVDIFCFSRHNEQFRDNYRSKFNDYNYLTALSLAKGTYVAHFDADMAAFSRNKDVVLGLLNHLENYDFLSYNVSSDISPDPVKDPRFDYRWCSTRFFLCKQELVHDTTEIRKCLDDADYLYGKYGDRQARCPWMEHILGLMAKKSGIYPPFDYSNYVVFSWSNYCKGILEKMNNMNYDQIKQKVRDWGYVQYPVNLVCHNF